MKKSTKSVLLSMFVFPGAGHFFLKKYVAGLFFSVGAAAATYAIVSSAVKTALEMVGNIQTGSIPLDLEIGSLLELLSHSQQSYASGNDGSTHIAMIVWCLFWLGAILDSFRIGHLLDSRGVGPH